MYSIHNEGKSVVTERFKKTFKGKIYKKWQLIIVNLTHSALTREIETNPKARKFKVGDRVRITK